MPYEKAKAIVSMNLRRRHLSDSQRGMVAARIAKLGRGANKHTSIEGTSQQQAADLLNVGVATVERAKAVQEKTAPEVVAAVDKGELTVDAALPLAELPKDEQSSPRPVSSNGTEIHAKQASLVHSAL
jgi:hypothetical protein